MQGFPHLAPIAAERQHATEMAPGFALRPLRNDRPTRFAWAVDGRLMIE
jgi:hypothetical protein